MSLHISSANPGITALDPAIWSAKLKTYALLREGPQNADSAARAAKAAADGAQTEILTAMRGSTAATCGNMIVTVKTGKEVAAALTLTSGQKVPWEKVTGLTIGNAYVDAKEVQTLYGGRSASVSIEVAGG